MKIIVRLFLVCLIFLLISKTNAQNLSDTPVSCDYNNSPLKTVLLDLEKQLNVKFSYLDQLIKDKFITVDIKNKKLSDVLNIILNGTNLSFKIVEQPSNIIIYKQQTTNNIFIEKFTIHGFVEDAGSGERLAGVNIYEPDMKVGTTSNKYGFYSLSLPSNSEKIIFSYMGYESYEKELFLDKDIRLNVELELIALETEAIVVESDRYESIVNATQMGRMEITMKQVQLLPVLLGEADVFKSLQLLPGVQSGNEGTNALHIRGGSPDQNLILLDGAPVYNPSHLFGFFSIFNMDAIKGVSVYKGDLPARFGGRLSSVVDLNMKEGNMKEYKGSVSLGLASSRIGFEGPIIKDKSSFMISGRISYVKLAAWQYINKNTDIDNYDFYDFNGKINYILSDKNRLYLSGYIGYDDSYTEKTNNGNELFFGNNQKNTIGTLRWNHIVNNKMFANLTCSYSKYKFDTNTTTTFLDSINVDSLNADSTYGSIIKQIYQAKYFSEVEDFIGKIDIDLLPSPEHSIKFGVEGIYRNLNPGVEHLKIAGTGILDSVFTPEPPIIAYEYAAYLEDEFELTNSFKTNIGLRWSGMKVNNKLYSSLEPRISARYLLSKTWSIKAAYSKMTQYLHMLSNSGAGVTTDLWVPATETVVPEKAWQTSIGTSLEFWDKQFEVSLEGYYKKLDNLIEYKEGSDFLGNDESWQNKVENGEGESYGLELLLRKKQGNFTGWFGYSLAFSERTFKNLNFGRTYPYKYDRRHNISSALNYVFGKFEASSTWVFNTGHVVTLPTARYLMINVPFRWLTNYNWPSPYELEWINKRNNFRLNPYHRLDLSLTYTFNLKYGKLLVKSGYYNVYQRKNPYLILLERDINDEYSLRESNLLSGIPYINIIFNF